MCSEIKNEQLKQALAVIMVEMLERKIKLLWRAIYILSAMVIVLAIKLLC